MKKVLTLAAAVLVLGASTASAQGLNLYFGGCSDGGTLTQSLNCGSNTGLALTLHASVFPGSPLTLFAAATAVVDIKAGPEGGPLPLWWQTASGQCRANSISMSFDPANNNTACGDLWGGNPNLQVTAIQQGLHGSNSVRVNGVAALPAGSEIPVAVGTELWVCRITINKTATTTCAGCSQPASIVLNEISMQEPGGAPQRINNVVSNSCASISGGPCPGATPAANRTWGAVKSLYNR